MSTLITPQADRVWHHLNPFGFVRSLWGHGNLILQFTVREVQGRYKASSLGLLWSFLHPLLLLLIYTFVFGVVFQARWPHLQRTGDLAEFALVLFCGLIPFNLLAECVSRASSLVITVPSYVRKIPFPLEILPVSAVGSACFHAAVSLGALVAMRLVTQGAIAPTLVLVPLVLLPLLFLCLGLTWFVASLVVFLRDVGHVVPLALQVLLFATPIFYPLDAVPERFQPMLRCNPLALIVEDFRRVVLWDLPPDWGRLAGSAFVGAVVMLLGYAWFMKTKRGFADVL
jgi:lipopolysaccharide transport system permease protein